MTYVALLRGINVGGNNKVEMKKLKATFERVGMTKVRTYINSGNIIFENKTKSAKSIVTELEKAISEDFGFFVKVLVLDFETVRKIAEALPSSFVNDDTTKCDVMYLWENVNKEEVLRSMVIKEGIDDVRYVPGAVIWKVERKDINRSGLLKLVGTKLYKEVTVRNCNTARKLYELMKEVEGL
jgi:uncharacterized protein (DUF1697 family)